MAPEWSFRRTNPLVQITGDLKAVICAAGLVVDNSSSQFVPDGAPRCVFEAERLCKPGRRTVREIESHEDTAALGGQISKLCAQYVKAGLARR